MRLSVVIVSWNTKELLRRCLATLHEETEGLSSEVFVVDNNSADGSASMVRDEHPWVVLIANEENLGFAKANNQALKVVQGDYVLILNPDTEVQPGAVATLIAFLESHPQVAVVAPQLLNSDMSIQRSCRRFPTFAGMLYEFMGLSRMFPQVEEFRHYKMLDWGHDDEREVDQPEGACLMVRREVITQLGAFDEGYFMLFEEVDWCYRVKQAGWQIWFTPQAKIVHHYGQSIKQVKVRMIISSHKGLYRYWRKHLRGNKWYLDGVAYVGLMSLAGLRIAAYQLARLAGRGSVVAPKVSGL